MGTATQFDVKFATLYSKEKSGFNSSQKLEGLRRPSRLTTINDTQESNQSNSRLGLPKILSVKPILKNRTNQPSPRNYNASFDLEEGPREKSVAEPVVEYSPDIDSRGD